MTEETKIALEEFLTYLVKEGYCDTDVYSEPPSPGMTVIDHFMIKRKPTKNEVEKITDINDPKLHTEIQYWAGYLYDIPNNYEVAQEIVDAIKMREKKIERMWVAFGNFCKAINEQFKNQQP